MVPVLMFILLLLRSALWPYVVITCAAISTMTELLSTHYLCKFGVIPLSEDIWPNSLFFHIKVLLSWLQFNFDFDPEIQENHLGRILQKIRIKPPIVFSPWIIQIGMSHLHVSNIQPFQQNFKAVLASFMMV